jgi:hypothetical protein
MGSSYTSIDILSDNNVLQSNLLGLTQADFPEYIVPLRQINSTLSTGLTVWERYPSEELLQNILSLYIDALCSWLADIETASSWSRNPSLSNSSKTISIDQITLRTTITVISTFPASQYLSDTLSENPLASLIPLKSTTMGLESTTTDGTSPMNNISNITILRGPPLQPSYSPSISNA